jgi:hypothetical protein
MAGLPGHDPDARVAAVGGVRTTMANDIPTTNGTTTSTALAPTDGDGGQPIAAFSNEANFKTAQRMANALANSSLVPEAYRGNIPNVLIAMELASRVGASVFAVMQNLDIIHGQPSWRAKFLIATVNACGRFTPMRFRFAGTEGTETWGCRAIAKDRESGEDCVGPLVTMAMAKAEGWSTKSGSKWKTLPELMLSYRAAAFWTRLYAPELSLGMATAEEAQDIHARPEIVQQLPTALVPGNAKTLEADLLGKAPEPPSKPAVEVEIDPETGEIVPPGAGIS